METLNPACAFGLLPASDPKGVRQLTVLETGATVASAAAFGTRVVGGEKVFVISDTGAVTAFPLFTP